MKAILLILGSGILTIGIFLLIFANFTLGNLLTFILGAFFMLWGIFEERIKELTEKGVLKYVKYAFLTLLCAGLLLVSFIAAYGSSDNATYKEDAVIVLGAAVRGEQVTLPLQYRLDKAIEYHKKNTNLFIKEKKQ